MGITTTKQTLEYKIATLDYEDSRDANTLYCQLEAVKQEMQIGLEKGVYNPNFKNLTKEGKKLVREINKILRKYNCKLETPSILRFY